MSLQEQCLLVTLEIGLPPLTRKAMRASEDAETKYKTAKRQVGVKKNLFARRDIFPIQQAASAARTLFNDLSLPYDQNRRIIPTNSYFSFVEKMAGVSAIFDSLRHKFLNEYHITLMRSEMELGTLWRGDDYPSVNTLKEKMYFSIESTVIPSMTGFDALVGLDEEELEKIKREAVKGQQAKVDEALKNLVGRLRTSLNKAAIRLADTDTYFKDTLIGNITAALEAVETLNITKDEKLIELANEVRETMEGITPKDLRKDEKLREETAEDAQKLVDKMSDFF